MLYIAFVLALAFIFLILAAQFESFIDPLIAMLSAPLAMSPVPSVPDQRLRKLKTGWSTGMTCENNQSDWIPR